MATEIASLYAVLGLNALPFMAGLKQANVAIDGTTAKLGLMDAGAGKAAVGLNATGAAAFAGSKGVKVFGEALMAAGVVLAVIGVESIHAAGDFQELTTALVTGAGEIEHNLEEVSTGLLAMAGEVGVSANELAKGMYMVESAGYHGAEGLQVMEAAAKGGKIGMADQAVVADALTTVLKDYKLKASDAAGVTGQMTAAVAAGKMHWEDFAGSLSKALPIAASLNIPFQQAAAALSVMTAHGIDAARAATTIQAGLMQLIDGLKTSTDALEALGVNAEKLRTKLASGDLIGTLDMIANAMKTKLPAGAEAGMAKVQQAIKDGLDPGPAMEKFQATVGPAYAKVVGDMIKAFGGLRGGALALTLIPNIDEMKANITSIGTLSEGAAKSQAAWALVQEDLNTKIDQAKAKIGAMAITLGTALLPVAIKFFDAITPIITAISSWITVNPKLAATIVGVGAAVGILGGTLLLLAPQLVALGMLLGRLTIQTTVHAAAETAVGAAGAAAAAGTLGYSAALMANTAAILANTAAQQANIIAKQATMLLLANSSGAIIGSTTIMAANAVTTQAAAAATIGAGVAANTASVGFVTLSAALGPVGWAFLALAGAAALVGGAYLILKDRAKDTAAAHMNLSWATKAATVDTTVAAKAHREMGAALTAEQGAMTDLLQASKDYAEAAQLEIRWVLLTALAHQTKANMAAIAPGTDAATQADIQEYRALELLVTASKNGVAGLAALDELQKQLGDDTAKTTGEISRFAQGMQDAKNAAERFAEVDLQGALDQATLLSEFNTRGLEAQIKALEPQYRAIEQATRAITLQERGWKDQQDAIRESQARIKSQLDGIATQEQAIRDHATAVKDSYDAQTAALQEQIGLLTQIDPADKEKDLALQLRKNALEQQLAHTDARSAQAKIIQGQIDQLDKQAKLNRLRTDEKQITGQIAAIPLEQQLKDLNTQRDAELKKINATLNPLESQRKSLEAQNKALDDANAAIDTKLKGLDLVLRNLGDQKTVLDDTKVSLQDQEDFWTTIVTQSQDALDNVTKYAAILAGLKTLPPVVPGGPGESPFPNLGAIGAGRMPFEGARTQTSFQGGSHWWGVDWAMPKGTQLEAIGDAIVERFGDLGDGWGNTMVLKLANGMKAYYAHLSKALVGVGDIVTAGQAVALSGGVPGEPGAGTTTGPHLDFRLASAAGSYLDVIHTLRNWTPPRFGTGGGVGGPLPDQAAFDLVERIQGAMETLKQLRDFVGPADGTVADFAHAMQIIVSRIAETAAALSDKGVPEAEKFALAAGNIMGMIEPAVLAMGAFKDFKVYDGAALKGFTDGLYQIVNEIERLRWAWSEDAVISAMVFADNAGKTVAIIGTGIDAMDRLQDMTLFTGADLTGFEDGLWQVVNAVKDMAMAFTGPTLDDAMKFSDSAIKIASLLSAVENLQKLNKFTGPSKEAINNFNAVIRLFIQNIATMASEMDKDGVAAAAAFSESGGKVFGMLSTALNVILAVGKAQKQLGDGGLKLIQTGPHAYTLGKSSGGFLGAINVMKTQMTAMIEAVQGLAKDFPKDSLTDAVRFSTQASAIFSMLQAGIKALTGWLDKTMIQRLKDTAKIGPALMKENLKGLIEITATLDTMLAMSVALVETSRKFMEHMTVVGTQTASAMKFSTWEPAPVRVHMPPGPAAQLTGAAAQTNQTIHVTVNTAAMDARGIVDDLERELSRRLGERALTLSVT